MNQGGRARYFAAILISGLMMAGAAEAATCGNDARGFEQWKASFSQEAAARGIGSRALNALAGTTYAQKTISADRGQRSFKLTLNEFMQKRGSHHRFARQEVQGAARFALVPYRKPVWRASRAAD